MSRRCSDPLSRGCVTLLSRYNASEECGPCQRARADRVVSAMQSPIPRGPRPCAGRRGGLTEQVRCSLPGTAGEVAMMIGHPAPLVSRILSELLRRGEVIVSGTNGGRSGHRKIYRLTAGGNGSAA